MTPKEETRLLSGVLKRLEGDSGISNHGRWFAIVNWLILVAAFVALFSIGPRVGTIVYVVACVACLLGVTTSLVVIYQRSVEQWPVLSRFISADEIRRRLDELKIGGS